MIEAKEVQKLREETGAGVIASKQALEQSGGDFRKAKMILAENAEAIVKKKAERAATKGLIEVYVHGGRIGVLLELAAESDFVTRNAEFRELAHDLALQIASMNPKNTEELVEQAFIRDESKTVGQLLAEKIAKIGENIQIKRFIRYELGEEG